MKIKYQTKKIPKLNNDYSVLTTSVEEGEEFFKLARSLGKYWTVGTEEEPDYKVKLDGSPQGIYYCIYERSSKYYFREFKSSYPDMKEKVTLQEFKKIIYEN